MINVRFPSASFVRRTAAMIAACALVATVTATWLTSSTADAGPSSPKVAPAPARPAPVAPADDDTPRPRGGGKTVTGKLNLNTATAEQLQLLPGVGPAKAERVVAWRGKHGEFKRVADLRKVKGFGYKSLKKLEPYLDIKGETTLRTP